MIDTILWTQNESPTKANTLIIDGVAADYCGLPEQDEAMRIINRGEISQDCTQFDYPAARSDLGLSSNFKINIPNEHGLFIQGIFEEKDEGGRNMPFMFVSKTLSDFDSAIEVLKEYSSMIGRTLIMDDLLKIPKLLEILGNQKKNKRGTIDKKTMAIMAFLAIIAILTIIIIIWKIHYCKSPSLE